MRKHFSKVSAQLITRPMEVFKQAKVMVTARIRDSGPPQVVAGNLGQGNAAVFRCGKQAERLGAYKDGQHVK